MSCRWSLSKRCIPRRIAQPTRPIRPSSDFSLLCSVRTLLSSPIFAWGSSCMSSFGEQPIGTLPKSTSPPIFFKPLKWSREEAQRSCFLSDCFSCNNAEMYVWNVFPSETRNMLLFHTFLLSSQMQWRKRYKLTKHLEEVGEVGGSNKQWNPRVDETLETRTPSSSPGSGLWFGPRSRTDLGRIKCFCGDLSDRTTDNLLMFTSVCVWNQSAHSCLAWRQSSGIRTMKLLSLTSIWRDSGFPPAAT